MELKELIKKIIEKYNNNFLSITITTIYNNHILKGKYNLQEDEHLGKIIVLDAPLLIDEGYTMEDSRIQKPFSEKQKNNFVMKLEKNVSKENLVTMYNNLYNLKIKEQDIILIMISYATRVSMGLKKGMVGGFYNLKKNKIITYSPIGDNLSRQLFKSESEITLEGEYSHELLHMSSTIKKQNKICSGFNHLYFVGPISQSIGLGINEGYTELLNERIFNVKNNGGPYEIYKIVAELVENIVGKDKMTQLYFSSDLKSLILEMSKYIDQQQTKKFIIDLDSMVKNPNNINDIIKYLLTLYNNKIEHDIKNKKITKEEATLQYEKIKINIIKLSAVFNRWIETKRNTTKVQIENFDNIIEKQKKHSLSRSRGNVHFATLFVYLNIFALLITIIYLLCLR